MNPIVVYNLTLVIAVGCIAGGVFLTFGPGASLMATGVLMLALTIYAAERLRG